MAVIGERVQRETGWRRGRHRLTVTGPVALRRRGPVSRAFRAVRQRVRPDPWTIAILLVALIALVTAAVLRWPGHVPEGAFAPIAIIAGLVLSPRPLFAVYLAIAVGAVVVLVDVPERASFGLVAMGALVLALMYWLSRSRAHLGVQGVGGERMLVDLRDRLRLMGELPDLPRGWHAEAALESAHGDAFSGDFMVTARSQDGTTLEIVLVDVSGKGLQAGTRSLLLSGAFSGLLGSTDAGGFLPAANAYLLRQAWGEGFATAVHVQICTETGSYTVATAGHPPAASYSAGSGKWSVIEGEHGPLLGVMPDAPYPRRGGVLGRGDALLLYTDGVIESRNRKLADGIDRMLGTAERSRRAGFSGVAGRICNAARSGESDDRAVVVVWRS